MAQELLRIQDLEKNYGGVHALSGVSFSIRKGETHALVGENGAGKSTLIKILTGAEIPTAGSIEFDGDTYGRMEPKQALDLGIVAIYQELNLIPFLSVSENIFFGCEMMKGLFRDTAAMKAETVKLCSEMGVEIDPDRKIHELGMAYKQIVEIVKAISKNAKLLIMDEPTAPLTDTETEALFEIVRKLKERGVTIIFITHRLDEIFTVCDRVTVMRDGQYIDTLQIGDTDKNHIMELMVGRELFDDYPKRESPIGKAVLEVEGLSNRHVDDVSFTLHAGEILGFGGLVGAGRTEMALALFGVDRIDKAAITLNGKKLSIDSPEKALAHGIGLIPEDRKNQGLVLSLPVGVNISFSILKRLSKFFMIRESEEQEVCNSLKDDLQIKTPDLKNLAKNLSGGNQQKVVLAKYLATECEILIFDEPTRGIDVGAKQEIYHLMRKLTEMNKSIIMISSEMPELIGMSDRILVMKNGKINGELQKSEFSQKKILAFASQE